MESTILDSRPRRSRLRLHFSTSAAMASRTLPTVASRLAPPAPLMGSGRRPPPPVRESTDTVGNAARDGVACRSGAGVSPSVPGMLRVTRLAGATAPTWPGGTMLYALACCARPLEPLHRTLRRPACVLAASR